MAQSTTIQNAKALYIGVGGNDVSGSAASAQLTVAMDNSLFATADGDFYAALVGKRQWSGTLNVYYSETAGQSYKLLATAFEGGTSTALVLSALGNDSTEETLTGNVYFTSMPYSFDATTADAILLAVPFIGNGTLTRANVA
jgi:hypothetical protein